MAFREFNFNSRNSVDELSIRPSGYLYISFMNIKGSNFKIGESTGVKLFVDDTENSVGFIFADNKTANSRKIVFEPSGISFCCRSILTYFGIKLKRISRVSMRLENDMICFKVADIKKHTDVANVI